MRKRKSTKALDYYFTIEKSVDQYGWFITFTIKDTYKKSILKDRILMDLYIYIQQNIAADYKYFYSNVYELIHWGSTTIKKYVI